MKIFLFGGAETGQARRELKMIEAVIKKIKPAQVLLIPFARAKAYEAEWKGDWFNRNIKLEPGTKYLNAGRQIDLAEAKSPLIFMSGGNQILNLAKKIKANSKLARLIKKADVIIGESAGAKILGAYFRIKGSDDKSKMKKGLGIIKDTVIVPHYIQRHRQESLITTGETESVRARRRACPLDYCPWIRLEYSHAI